MAEENKDSNSAVSRDGTPGKSGFEPFIPASKIIPELTPLPLILGVILGMIFGASSLYLVLKVGLTVSASIPVAVISITLFKILSKFGVRRATILENNIVQTAGSAGESIAFGIGVTMPAILILGFDLEIARVMLVAILGGLLGILMMIPLRRALIVKQHGILKYPEGTACAEVLKAGAAESSADGASSSQYKGAHTIFAGFGIGLVYKILMVGFKLWKEIPEKIFGSTFKGGSISAEISPELLGVGYIIGPRLGAIMCGGGVLAYLVLIPAIKFFGDGLTAPLPPGLIPIKEMSPNDIRSAYILYIGAGAVAAGGIISMIRSFPLILHGIREGLIMLKLSKQGSQKPLRTEHDMSLRVVFGGIVVLITAIVLSPPLHMNLGGAILIVIFGFLFSTVSSRLTGEIGSSSNPISGMTVATLLITCLIFLALGWTDPIYQVTALSVGGIVCIAASNAGTTSQDLKTGYLVGATPRLQQIAILFGAFSSALILGPILLKLNQTGTVYVPQYTYEIIQPSVKLPEPLKFQPLTPVTNLLSTWTNPPYRLVKIYDEKITSQLKIKQGDYVIDGSGNIVSLIRQNFSDSLRAPLESLKKTERLQGPQAKSDNNSYFVWHKTNNEGGPAGKYLVDETGKPVYYVDPGINGTHKVRPDGTVVTKFDAPKATLMSYIIKGILSRELPWGLVILGVMIAIVLELASVPSLAFAVGVYLPISSSMPIFIGGMIRWLVDKYLSQKRANKDLTPEQLAAESDRSPGVLLASGYIAGGAIAGIAIAFMLGVFGDFARKIEEWASQHNPLYNGRYADIISLLPFFILCVLLYLAGRELIFRQNNRGKA